MEKEFVHYEEALALKELGFNEDCLARFDGGGFRMLPVYDPLKNSEVKEHWFCVTPLYQQAFRWFREKYNLERIFAIIPPEALKSNPKLFKYNYYIWGLDYNPRIAQDWNCSSNTYEEAESACLRKLIEITKSKKDD